MSPLSFKLDNLRIEGGRSGLVIASVTDVAFILTLSWRIWSEWRARANLLHNMGSLHENPIAE